MITKTFSTPGSFVLWQVPSNIDPATPVRCVLDGATGGPIPLSTGGYFYPLSGDHVEGDRVPVAGQNWYMAVGQGGGATRPGWNGGGTGGTGPGGAGATAIHVGDTTLASRIAVAGGSGGVPPSGSVPSSYNGGDATGSAGGAAGGGSNAGTAGTLGQGGAGGSNSAHTTGGGGGGAGEWGGGGGGTGVNPATYGRYVGAGGRGSSYTGGLGGTIVNTLAGAPGGSSASAANAGRDGQINISWNLIPNAPTPLGPASGSSVDRTLATVLRWMFSDDDPLDTPSAYEVFLGVNGGALVSQGVVTSSTSAATVAANTFNAGDVVEWQVRTWDASGAVGARSASFFFTACNPPATSFAFDPALTGIAARQPVVTGHRSDTTAIAQWRFQIVNDASGSPGTSVLADTGVITAPSGATTVTQTLPDVAYANGASYHVLGMIAYPAGVWQHAWTDSGPLTANIQPPPTPLLTAVANPYVDTVPTAAPTNLIPAVSQAGPGAAPASNGWVNLNSSTVPLASIVPGIIGPTGDPDAWQVTFDTTASGLKVSAVASPNASGTAQMPLAPSFWARTVDGGNHTLRLATSPNDGFIGPTGIALVITPTWKQYAYAPGSHSYLAAGSSTTPSFILHEAAGDEGLGRTFQVWRPRLEPAPAPTPDNVPASLSGTVSLSWANPTPSDPTLAAVSVDVYRTEGGGPEERIFTGLPINSSTVDRIPAGSTAGLPVAYRVVALTATGASASSA